MAKFSLKRYDAPLMEVSAMRSLTQIALQTAEKFWRDEDGQTLVEYALIVNFLTLVILLSLSIMGKRLSSTFSNVTNALKT